MSYRELREELGRVWNELREEQKEPFRAQHKQMTKEWWEAYGEYRAAKLDDGSAISTEVEKKADVEVELEEMELKGEEMELKGEEIEGGEMEEGEMEEGEMEEGEVEVEKEAEIEGEEEEEEGGFEDEADVEITTNLKAVQPEEEEEETQKEMSTKSRIPKQSFKRKKNHNSTEIKCEPVQELPNVDYEQIKDHSDQLQRHKETVSSMLEKTENHISNESYNLQAYSCKVCKKRRCKDKHKETH